MWRERFTRHLLLHSSSTLGLLSLDGRILGSLEIKMILSNQESDSSVKKKENESKERNSERKKRNRAASFERRFLQNLDLQNDGGSSFTRRNFQWNNLDDCASNENRQINMSREIRWKYVQKLLCVESTLNQGVGEGGRMGRGGGRKTSERRAKTF